MKLWKKPAVDPLAGFAPMAEDDWPESIEDRWPAGRLRRTAMAAYDEMARAGEIRPMGVYKDRAGATLVRYRARIPAAWVRELMGKAERLQNAQQVNMVGGNGKEE